MPKGTLGMYYIFALCIIVIVVLLTDAMYRSYSSGTPMGLMLGNATLTCAVVVISYAVNYTSHNRDVMALFCCIQNIGVIWSFYFIIRFSIHFAERKPLTMTIKIIAMAVLMLDSAIVLTSPINELAFAIEYREGRFTEVAALSPRPLFLIHCFLCFIEVFAIVLVLLDKLFKSAKMYAAKYLLVIAIVLLMGIPEGIFAIDSDAIFDYSVIFFGLAGACLCYAAFILPAILVLGSAQGYLSEFMPGVVAMYDNAGVLINKDKRALDVIGRLFPQNEAEMRELVRFNEPNRHIMHSGREYSVTSRRISDKNGFHVLTAYTFTDVTESTILIGKEHHYAITDPLTGINNRAGFFEQAELFLTEHGKENCYALLMSGINGFKDINRLYGTKNGDAVLKQIATRISNLKGRIPLVCGRIAESKFSLLLPFDAIDEVVDSLSTLTVATGDAREISVDMRHGFVVMDKGLTLDEYFELAIAAFVNSKKNSGFNVVEYSDDLLKEQKRREALIADVRKAIDNRDFVIDLQPHVDIREHKVVGAKAWACWEHPTYGRLENAEFINLLEEAGFISELNRYVWREAAATLERFSSSGLFNGYISVELDKENILKHGTADELIKLLREYGLEPDRLHLVIRNYGEGEDRDAVIKSIREFRTKGFYIEEADFGKGITNIENFLRTPFDGEIVSMHVLHAAYESARPELTASSFISAFTNMGIDAIVTGIDSEEELELVKRLNVKIAEGKVFSNAVPLREFAGFVKKFNK